MTFEKYELRGLLADAAELGAQRALIMAGELAPYMSKAEAYRQYGRSQVDRWLKEELLTPVKDGTKTSRVRLDRMQLEVLAKSSNRFTYLNSIER